jgi:hypothetical protein
LKRDNYNLRILCSSVAADCEEKGWALRQGKWRHRRASMQGNKLCMQIYFKDTEQTAARKHA